MKAFVLYPREKRDLYTLLDKLKLYGECNCDFEIFSKIYNEWHLKTFPGRPINNDTAIFRNDWLSSFINFLANYEIKGDDFNG